MKMITNTNIKTFFIFTVLSFLGVSCGCSDKECKSTRDCETGFVCKNGDCVDVSTTDTQSDSDSLNQNGSDDDSDSSSDTNTSTDPRDSDSDTQTDDTDTQTDSDSDTSTAGNECTETWECNDDNACTTESCTNGVCVYRQAIPVPAGCCSDNDDCNDSDECTSDNCNSATFTCQYTDATGENCCLSDTDCNDSNSCTIDSCAAGGACIHIANDSISGCCANENDCGSSNCSTITCEDYACVYSFLDTTETGCCVVDGDCPPGEGACTVATCNEKGECEYETNPSLATDCCIENNDCDDGNNCNVDVCTFEYTCVHTDPVVPADGCCIDDGDCSDGDNCTADVCNDNICSNTVHDTDNMPAGCCSVDAHCDDWNDCTTDLCFMGRCYSNGDPSLGDNCCYVDTDCNDSNDCTVDSCDAWNSECVHLAPDAGAMPSGCCLVDEDCTDTDNLCNIGSCGIDPKYTCEFVTAADDTPCDNDSWCDGPEVCSSGTCVTRTGDLPCNGPLGPCRLGSCDDVNRECTVAAEYDTDVSCNDDLFCNGTDLCQAGDCVHFNPPCLEEDTDALGICEKFACDEDNTQCVVDFKPNYTPCDNSTRCDGVNMCVDGVCESNEYCGEGNDCAYYICDEDTDGGLPVCTFVLAENGIPCTTPDLGPCFGTENRMCLNGTCTIGTDYMCESLFTGGFCKDYICKPEWGEGVLGSGGGCGEDPTDYSFATVGCLDETDTSVDTAAGPDTIDFSTAMEYNRVSDYGTTCGSGFSGGDSIYQIYLTAGQTITVTLSEADADFDTDTNVETTNGQDVYVMILPNACNPTGCVDGGVGTAEYTAPIDGMYYIVIDMVERAYATGQLNINCH
ncbi:MAG: hypothetical protein JXX29_07225 [Deltaproteobacteria bacterium]|nr:hypothetical protein [Deltaproteobacteria bacterium]MBN2671446.1 hypothetical protein [Deltaproteobacteria bacterium]